MENDGWMRDLTLTLSRCSGGWVGVVTGRGIFANTLPEQDEERALKNLRYKLGNRLPTIRYEEHPLADMIYRLWMGEDLGDAPLRVAMDYHGYTEKEIEILEDVRRIPRGKVRSYGEVAERVGLPKAARFVGNVMAKNRCPLIIPCHRVIKGDGRVGRYGVEEGGSKVKYQLLLRENCRNIRI
jgi:methylated-DNA-[protein]-cysteine S-methyltransferase